MDPALYLATFETAVHFYRRTGLLPQTVRSCHIGAGVITFYLYNLSGQLVGYQEYRPNAPKLHGRSYETRHEQRYWTYVSKHPTGHCKLAVWGLESYTDTDKPLYLVEGVFDAIALHRIDRQAIAVLGNDPVLLKGWLRTLSNFKIALCDGDDAGRKLGKYANFVVGLSDGQDAASLSSFELQRCCVGAEVSAILRRKATV